MLLGKLCRSRSVYSGGRLLTLLIAEEELRGLELAIDELRQSFARVLELRAIVGISHPFTSFCRCHAASREAVDAQRFAGESGIYHISQIAAESGTAQTDLGACSRRWTICCAPAAVRSWKSSSCRASAHRAARRRATA